MRAVLVLILAWFCLGWGEAARAHAVLLETVPSDRSVIAQSPDVLILRFNETVQPIVVELRDSNAQKITTNAVVVDHEIHIVPRVPLSAGSFFLSYRVTSADSHPVAGSFLFAVGRAPAEWAAPSIVAANYSGWSWAAAIDRAIYLSAILLVAGAWTFAFIMRQPIPLRRLVVRLGALGAASALIGIYLQGGVLLDSASATPWDGEIWRVGLSSTRGTALLLATAGLVLCMARSRPITGFGVVLAIASFVLSGHAATATPRWIALPALVLHIAAAAFWLGSFVPLLAALGETRTTKRSIFRRFSEFAMVVVPQLALAGALLAVLQIQQVEALFTTAYGLLLALKLSFVGLLGVIGACNRWILMPEMRDDVDGHATRFRYAIRTQLALGIAVLGATAFLSQTVPPRTLFEHETAQLEASRTAGQTVLIVARDRKALLSVTPARPGRNTIRTRILGNDDAFIEPLEVSVDLSNGDVGIEPLHRKLVPAADGYFENVGPELAIAGRWTIRIEVLINDFEKAIFETEITVN